MRQFIEVFVAEWQAIGLYASTGLLKNKITLNYVLNTINRVIQALKNASLQTENCSFKKTFEKRIDSFNFSCLFNPSLLTNVFVTGFLTQCSLKIILCDCVNYY